MSDITPKEAIANLNHIYGMVAPDIQRSLDLAIKALERPQGDLISRSDIRKEIGKMPNANPSYSHKCDVVDREDVLDKIDNAQAVDTTCPNCDSGYAQGYSDGYLKGKEERPQGEWIEYNATGKKQYMCSKCSMEEKNPKIARYCYWCGAKMKDGAE